MKFRTGLVTGFAAGYVLGARAGRERYVQIKQWAAEFRKHPAISQIIDQVVAVLDLARTGVANGLNAGSRGLRSTTRSDKSA